MLSLMIHADYMKVAILAEKNIYNLLKKSSLIQLLLPP